MFLFYFKTNYEISTPISLKTNNKKPNYFTVHLHVCVSVLRSERIHIQLYIKTVVIFKQISISSRISSKVIYTL